MWTSLSNFAPMTFSRLEKRFPFSRADRPIGLEVLIPKPPDILNLIELANRVLDASLFGLRQLLKGSGIREGAAPGISLTALLRSLHRPSLWSALG